MDDLFAIQEGISIPKATAGRENGGGKYQRLERQMKPTTEIVAGSSILLTGKKAKTQSNAIRVAFNKRGFNIVTRREGDGLRIWKIVKQ